MKRTRGRVRARSGPRRRTDWIPSLSDDVDEIVGPGVPFVYSLCDPTDVAEKDGAITVVRIVGDVTPYNPVTAGGAAVFAVIHAGIIVLESDQTGSVIQPDPGNLLDQDLPWLWIGHWHVQPLVFAAAPGQVVEDAFRAERHIDVRVARKMVDREFLALAVSTTSAIAATPPVTTSWRHYLRTLVKLS